MDELQVQIEVKDGINVVSSRVIAEQLGKEHSKVKRTLKSLIEQTPNVASDIFIGQYNDRGRMLEEYLLTRDGFTLYMFNIQGYNEFKMAYINKFNEMEKQLKENQLQLTKKQELQLKLFSNDSIEVVNAHKELVKIEIEEATKPLIETIETQEPKVEYHDNVLNSDKLITTTSIAKDLGMSARTLNKELHEKKIIYKSSGIWVLYAKYEHMIPEYCDYVINEYGQSLKWTELGRKFIIDSLKVNN